MPLRDRRDSRPRLLDLFCGAGGAAMGYHRVGFEVVGVDIEPQPDYPFEFHRMDALRVLSGEKDWPSGGGLLDPDAYSDWAEERHRLDLRHFDAIHASPPCKAYTQLSSMPTAGDHPRLLAPTIERLRRCDAPWVVENVGGARREFPRDLYRFQLCASSFGLRMYRHRWFCSTVFVPALECAHATVTDLVGVYGSSDGIHEPGHKHPGIRRGPRQATTSEARDVMGMPWATRRVGLTQAIPPAYTEHIGAYLMAELRARAAA